MGRGDLLAESERRFFEGVARGSEFFMGKGNVRAAMEKITTLLESLEIPYAIVGALSLSEYGYERFTHDVDLLLTREGLKQFKERWLGRGYVEKFEGSRGVRDVENDVLIDVVLAGDYPGDGKPKPVSFPDPSREARRGARVRLLPLERMIELKLASGMSAPHRLRDLADVVELIRRCQLPRGFDSRLDPSVREKFQELWSAAQTSDPE
jgi:hypothetical protein